MNTYYTAKDIEELATKGVQELEVGPGVSLTDFARETAQQLDITLIEGARQVSPSTTPTSPSNATVTHDKYNKPSGCQHPPNSLPRVSSQVSVPSDNSTNGGDSNTVNRLIDLMGKVIKRGE